MFSLIIQPKVFSLVGYSMWFGRPPPAMADTWHVQKDVATRLCCFKDQNDAGCGKRLISPASKHKLCEIFLVICCFREQLISAHLLQFSLGYTNPRLPTALMIPHPNPDWSIPPPSRIASLIPSLGGPPYLHSSPLKLGCVFGRTPPTGVGLGSSLPVTTLYKSAMVTLWPQF